MYFTYILTNKNNTVLYTGSTRDLKLRLFQHRNKMVGTSFTARYNVDKLLWFQSFETYPEAFELERRIKRWRRSWKIELIEKENPNWDDLAGDWDFDEYLA